jgi:hypothetical protein
MFLHGSLRTTQRQKKKNKGQLVTAPKKNAGGSISFCLPFACRRQNDYF